MTGPNTGGMASEEGRSLQELIADGVDPFEHFRHLSEELRAGGQLPASNWQPMTAPVRHTAASSPAIEELDSESADGPTSWADLLDDTAWLYEDDEAGELTGAAKSELWQRFGLLDVTTGLRAAISDIMGRPTVDFEWQYQAVYPEFDEAGAQLDRESARVESSGPDFAPIVDRLRESVSAQRARIENWRAEHVSRHREYREEMVPVYRRMAEDDHRSAMDRAELNRTTNQGIFEDNQREHARRVAAWERQNQEWSRTHLR